MIDPIAVLLFSDAIMTAVIALQSQQMDGLKIVQNNPIRAVVFWKWFIDWISDFLKNHEKFCFHWLGKDRVRDLKYEAPYCAIKDPMQSYWCRLYAIWNLYMQ